MIPLVIIQSVTGNLLLLLQVTTAVFVASQWGQFTPSFSPSHTRTWSFSTTASVTPSASGSGTGTPTASNTATRSRTATGSQSATVSASASATGTLPPGATWFLAFESPGSLESSNSVPLNPALWTANPAVLVAVTRSTRAVSNSLMYLTAGGGARYALLLTGGGADVNTSLVSALFYASAGTVVSGFTLFDTSEIGPYNNDYASAVLEDTAAPGTGGMLLSSVNVASLASIGVWTTPWRFFSVVVPTSSTYRFRFSVANAGDNLNPRCVTETTKCRCVPFSSSHTAHGTVLTRTGLV